MKNIFKLPLIITLLFATAYSSFAQEQTQYPKIEKVLRPDSLLTQKELKVRHRQQHRDTVRAGKSVWTTVLGGPSYTPEATLGLAAAVLLSFKTNKQDSIAQRSFIPFGFNASLNGTFVVAGGSNLFFNENRFRIYTTFGLRNEPANFYGVGMHENSTIERGEKTEFHKAVYYFNNRFVWEVQPKFYIGPTLDIGYTVVGDLSEFMQQHEYVSGFSKKYLNMGLGISVQYDTRDDVATPNTGVLLSAAPKIFGHYLGGDYNYQSYDLEYRQYKFLFGRSILGWVVRTHITSGDVPFTELPMFGSPFDLRGFYWGQYRDKSMGYAIAEYRQMLGSQQDYKEGKAISKFGYVVWGGAGTLGTTPKEWNEYKFNVGIGLRAQIQPRKNFRLDIGKGIGEKGVLFYMNMTEAF